MVHFEEKLQALIQQAFQEDVGSGDHSTLSCIDIDAKGKAVLKIKESGILAGVSIAEKIFRHAQPEGVVFEAHKKDGDVMSFGDTAFVVSADIHTILKSERIVLNCMQRMSGIATLTNQYTELLKGYKTVLLDTRKTTPNFRLLEKEAVRIGGGKNHRFGLYDMIMLKDNHIDYCGGIEKAIEKASNYIKSNHLDLRIEVETRSLSDVRAAVGTGKADVIMLDNFTPELIKEALLIIGDQCKTEASGGINISNIQSYAETGVDFISSGAIIHQAKSLDLSLKALVVDK